MSVLLDLELPSDDGRIIYLDSTRVICVGSAGSTFNKSLEWYDSHSLLLLDVAPHPVLVSLSIAEAKARVEAAQTARSNPENEAVLTESVGQAKFLTNNTPSQGAERVDVARVMDALEVAWDLIANAGGGDWKQETEGWQKAATAWRDASYFPLFHAYRKTLAHGGWGSMEAQTKAEELDRRWAADILQHAELDRRLAVPGSLTGKGVTVGDLMVREINPRAAAKVAEALGLSVGKEVTLVEIPGTAANTYVTGPASVRPDLVNEARPFPAQARFIESTAPAAVAVGGAGVGKTWALVAAAVAYCQAHARVCAALFRCTYPQLAGPGGLKDLVNTLAPHIEGAVWKPSSNRLCFANGSTLLLLHQKSSWQWQSLVAQFVGIDHLEGWAPEEARAVFARCRHTWTNGEVVDISPATQLRATCSQQLNYLLCFPEGTLVQPYVLLENVRLNAVDPDFRATLDESATGNSHMVSEEVWSRIETAADVFDKVLERDGLSHTVLDTCNAERDALFGEHNPAVEVFAEPWSFRLTPEGIVRRAVRINRERGLVLDHLGDWHPETATFHRWYPPAEGTGE